MYQEDRAKKYKKDPLAEHVLEQMNIKLESLEKNLTSEKEQPKLPLIFIIGAQRSGTTLLMQLLLHKYKLSYPSNFIARYWNSPFIGAVLFNSLNLEYRPDNFSSDLGYTKGLEGPHEFGYFWKRFYPWQPFEKSYYEKIDYTPMIKSLAAWQCLNNQPLIFKNLIYLTYNIEHLHKLFPTALFIYITREPIYIIQSTYLSRIKLFNNKNSWIGIKPKKFKELSSLPIVEQIASQVYHIKNDINNQLLKLPDSSYLSVGYEEMISNPNKTMLKIENKLKDSFILDHNYPIPKNLVSGNKIKIDKKLFEKFQSAYKSFA